ncbi:MAG: glutamate--tRNA ligase [Candidatus Paceibacterota bacterium]|jgi:glutamyl-tRNA synthetase
MADTNQKVVTRFAPSPTGLLHAGNYRTAIFSYLFAKQNNGEFIVRIEDTDKERSKKEYEENILESLEWLGLKYDAIHHQSKRLDRHQFYLQKMIDEGSAYISKEEAKDGSGHIKEIVRFKNPNKKITFKDMIRGEITTDTTDLGDFVIARTINEPLFHLAVVVDDFEMGVTHVIRGEDHIPNTPRHILIQEAIGAPMPIYAHLPLVLAPDRTKLSKRRGALAMSEYREQGYLPEALLNFMAFLGWNPGGEREIYDLKDLVDAFDITKVQKGGAIFNTEKLNWFNKEHIKLLSSEKLEHHIKEFLPATITELPHYSNEVFNKIIPIIAERLEKFSDVKIMTDEGELQYFFEIPTYDTDKLFAKNSKLAKEPDSKKTLASYLEKAKDMISEIEEDSFTADTVKNTIWNYAEEVGRGEILWPIRYSLSGRDKSPDPFTLAEVLGKKETIQRINQAIGMLQ